MAGRTYNDTNNLTNIVITDFVLSNGRLQCNLSAQGTILDISALQATSVLGVGILNNLQYLFVEENQIVEFNPTISLPSSLQILNLSNNQMTTAGYTASETWANGMHNAPSGGTISFQNNTDPLATSRPTLIEILEAKGWTVLV